MKIGSTYNKISELIETKIDNIFGEDRTLKNRIYNIETISLIVLLFIATVITLFLQKHMEAAVIAFICLAAQCVVFVICNYSKNINVYGVLSTLLMNVSLGVLAKFTVIQGIVGIYIIMALLYTILLFNGRKRVIILCIEAIYYLFLLIYDTSNIAARTVLYGTMLHTIVIFIHIMYISLSVGISLLTILKLYEKKNKRLNDINDYLSKMSITDPLTGAWNRNHMEQCLKKFIDEKKFPLSIIMMDIDFFKRVNDDYGHIMGDKILKKVVKIIKNVTGTKGIVTRYGGEEFLVILPSFNSNDTYEIAETIRKYCQKNLKIKDRNITISGGVAEYKNGQSIYTFIEEADKKLYEAKNGGRNRIVV